MLTPGSNELPRIKDIIEYERKSVSEVFTLLEPQKTYCVRIAARNVVGLGPEAVRNVTTSAKKPSKFRVFSEFFSEDLGKKYIKSVCVSL